MKPRLAVRYLRRAQDDLFGIIDYIARDSARAAERVVASLERAVGRLSAFPESGTVPRDARLAARGYRIVSSGEYLVFYRVVGAEVRVYRVIHGRRRYGGLL